MTSVLAQAGVSTGPELLLALLVLVTFGGGGLLFAFGREAAAAVFDRRDEDHPDGAGAVGK